MSHAAARRVTKSTFHVHVVGALPFGLLGLIGLIGSKCLLAGLHGSEGAAVSNKTP